MRIIRFLDADGRVMHGVAGDEQTATALLDPLGILGRATISGHRAHFRGRRAVVADDDANMRELIASVLTSVGCTCTVCVDGAEAVEHIEREHPSLVVSDVAMPRANGYEVLTAARRVDAHTPVVLVTGFGYDPTHTLVKAAEDGLETILYKPFTPQQLIDEVNRAIREVMISPADGLVMTDRETTVERLLAPVAPHDIIAIGRATDGGATTTAGNAPRDDLEVFLKPTGCVQHPGGPIRPPRLGDEDPQLDVEGELAIVIGREARHLDPGEAFDAITGFTLANDITARRWQIDGPPQWMRGKGFDTFCPLGPWIVTRDDIPDPDNLEVRTLVNGKLYRAGCAPAAPIAELVSGLSRVMTLHPGTVILTGAPALVAGPRALKTGDEITVEADGLGKLTNRIESATG